ncbi:uncharacterized protein LOC143432475 [Xylocopa sonorina]|uniref:uncharacterized protein LOC143432475 n=1 Tax=Xylocopa sonorina TaxID=1818115 RepID=UPI00403AFB92
MLTTSKSCNCTIIRGRDDKLKPDTDFSYSIKWYQKVVVKLICGTSLVNAWYIHRKWGTKRYKILKFREKIIDYLLKSGNPPSGELIVRQSTKYATNQTKKVTTFCSTCPDKPALCLECFKKLHR